MHLDIVTLFPGICQGPFNESILKRVQKQKLVEVNFINFRDYSYDKHKSVDDKPYGGGAGMLLKPNPLFEAIDSLRTAQSKVVLLTPQGEPFKQQVAQQLAYEKHLILVCGHYEGVDERIRQYCFDAEISIGDYILTNGALASLVVADALIRLLPGALGCSESSVTESFGSDKLLDFPQFTKPVEYKGMKVPQVLLSGNHKRISNWRQQQQILRTIARRPDLIK